MHDYDAVLPRSVNRTSPSQLRSYGY